MLFARFLAENHLLIHPDGVAISLEECEELAASSEAPNGYVLAARYASRMLPQIFRPDDVLLEIEFAPEHRLALEKLLAGLPRETFLADDSLGWVYQFWQTKKKDEVNKCGEKIDGRTLPAVTQLFTEHYMVQFLLHNTLGAWWCPGMGSRATGRCRRAGRQGPGRDGVPALAGRRHPGGRLVRWLAEDAREFTMLDPCCGCGHFLVAAFKLLVPLRMHDEGLSARRPAMPCSGTTCSAWNSTPAARRSPRLPWPWPRGSILARWAPLGYRPLPTLNIACSGQGVVGKKEDWAKFANGDSRFREGMERLYDLFQKAPDLGSLIDPRTVTEDLFALGFDTLQGTVERVLKKIEARNDPDRAALGVAAQGIALAASLMGREFTLVATNVPYLGRGNQSRHCATYADRLPTIQG